VVLPTVLGGIKVFDPYAQASALLAKMITRGLEPGPEPWKVLLQYRIKQLRLKAGGTSVANEEWLLTRKSVCAQGNPLWKGIWTAWLEVRTGLRKTPPTNKEEIQHQALFFNPHIKNPQTQSWGEAKTEIF
jgi:hypothetical protein